MSIARAAKLLGVSPATLRRLESGDEVKGYGIRVYRTPGGQRRYLESEIEQFSADRGFAGRIGFGSKPAVVVIDCINAFTRTSSPLGGDWAAEIANINKLTHVARNAGMPVAFSRSYYDDSDVAMRLWRQKIRGIGTLVPGSEEIEFDARVKVMPDDYQMLSKHISVFFQTSFLSFLRTYSVDTLVISGFSTSGSVRVAAGETIQYGIRPIVPIEAVGDREAHMHQTNLRDIDRKFADVLPLQDVLDHMVATAKAATGRSIG